MFDTGNRPLGQLKSRPVTLTERLIAEARARGVVIAPYTSDVLAVLAVLAEQADAAIEGDRP